MFPESADPGPYYAFTALVNALRATRISFILMSGNAETSLSVSSVLLDRRACDSRKFKLWPRVLACASAVIRTLRMRSCSWTVKFFQVNDGSTCFLYSSSTSLWQMAP